MHVIRLLLLLTTAKAAKVAPLPTGAKRFLVVGQPRAGSTWLTKYSPLLARCPGVVTTGEALHPLTVERLAPQLLGNDASAPLPLPDYTAYVRGVFEKLEPVWNQPVRRVHRQFFTKSFLGDEAAVLARSSGEEPAPPRHRAGVASMAWRSTRTSREFDFHTAHDVE